MSEVAKKQPPSSKSEPDAAVPPVIIEENIVKPRKSSLMQQHSQSNPAGGGVGLAAPSQEAVRKRSVSFRPSSTFQVHEEKAEDDADGAEASDKEEEKRNSEWGILSQFTPDSSSRSHRISDFQSVKLEEEEEDEEDAPRMPARPPTPPRGRKKSNNQV